MKIGYTGLDLPEGKTKCRDAIVEALTEKFCPAKVSPYFFDFMPGAYEQAEAIAVSADAILDLLILDMEKLETRLGRTECEDERAVLRRSLTHLEASRPLCDMTDLNGDRAALRELGPHSLKPTVVWDAPAVDPSDVGRAAMAKAGMMFFYTAGKQEVHAWFVEKNADAVTCAGRIHSDLARGFIKAELVSFSELMTAHNLNDARSNGLTRLVDRDFPVPEESVLDIRFNV